MTAPSAPRVDLVLLTWNRLDLLKPCVEQLRQHTDVPARLLIVDNGGTDPAARQYLEALAGTPRLAPEVIRLPQNLAIAQALNAGLARATAPWVCLLNNDILVTPGWLSELLRVAEAHPTIGLLNPMSNEFGRVPRPGETIAAVAGALRPRQGRWLENWGCTGFCVLLPQRVLSQVGLFDEQFQAFFYEDADYSLRVRQAGFDCAIAEGAYVYHHGSATLTQDPTRGERFTANAARFYAKWRRGPSRRIAWMAGAAPTAPGADAIREGIRRLANDDHAVTVYCTRRTQAVVPPHYRVQRRVLPATGFYWLALGDLLLKKKRFDQLVLSAPDRRPWFDRWRPWHHAAVTMAA